MALGGLLADSIKEQGQLPFVVTRLPKDKQVAGTVRYFRHHIWLNSLFYIANDNILDIGPNTEAAMAKYSHGDSYYYLLFIDYPGQKQAEAARAGFNEHFLSGSSSGIMQLEDGKWTGCKQYGNKLVVVFNAINKALVNKVMDLKKE